MDYPGPPATPSSSAATPTQLLEPNGLNGDSDPLINQVKQILAPKKLDQDPQGTATKLFELILPPSSEDGSATITITVDRDTRMEILNRIRDYAPKEFWNQFARNLRALALLREWGRQASKKEEFADTMMGWLQVVDKLPLTVDVLIQSQLGKIVKYIVDHAPTKVYSSFAYFFLGLDESFVHAPLLPNATDCGSRTGIDKESNGVRESPPWFRPDGWEV
ncbi:hypothetical protein FRC17_008631 [Serendipita sp. 399]|nr:hypothetical protein FRC17_008631 [Serendipita sp. 399]